MNVIHKIGPLHLSPLHGRIAPGHSGSAAVGVLRLNLIINVAKGNHVSFHSASRGKARSRKGTEVKDITIGGMHPPGDKRTIPRIDGKYFQHCGRAGQASLFPHTAHSYNDGWHGHPEERSDPAGRRFQTFRGVSLPGAAPLYGGELQGSRGSPPAARPPALSRASTRRWRCPPCHPARLQVSRPHQWWQCPPDSLPTGRSPLCTGDRS